jgi:hypothetical protein
MFTRLSRIIIFAKLKPDLGIEILILATIKNKTFSQYPITCYGLVVCCRIYSHAHYSQALFFLLLEEEEEA